MSKINIDELCEPIEIVVGGKTYKVEDISPETAAKMTKIKDGDDDEVMLGILAEILGAETKDLVSLGLRKRNMLAVRLMDTINDELKAKNVPEVAVKK